MSTGLLVALLTLLIGLPGEAPAGQKPKAPRVKRGAEKAMPLRHAPRMEFLTGTLSRDAAGWRLDSRRLLFREGFQVVGAGENGRPGGPVAGQRVLLSGIRTARGFQAQSGLALRPAPPDAPQGEGARTVIWSEVDPKVGIDGGPGRS
jgi:hypothetical protein